MIYVGLDCPGFLNFLGLLQTWLCQLADVLIRLALAPLPSLPTSANVASFINWFSYLNLWFPLDLLFTFLAGYFAFFIVYFVVKLVVRLF